MSGAKFVRLCSQLHRYDGAVRRRIESEQMQDQNSHVEYEVEVGGDFKRGESMSMGEALARSQGDEMAVLQQYDRDSKASGLGGLFEYETA